MAVSHGDIALGDLDADGDNDLVVSGLGATGVRTDRYLNDGAGVFSRVNANDLHAMSDASVTLVDVDGDDDLDILLLGTDDLQKRSRLYLNTGTGDFIEVNEHDIGAVTSPFVVSGDVTGNDAADLLVSGYTEYQYQVQLYQNDGLGEFTPVTIASHNYTDINSHSAQLGDLDNDSDLDIVVMYFADNSRFQLSFYENDGDGQFSLKSTQFAANGILTESSSQFHLTDIDGDSDVDIFLVHDATSFRHWAGSSGYLINDGDGEFGTLQSAALPTTDVSICSADMNADDLPDIIAMGGVHQSDGIYAGDHHTGSAILLNLDDGKFQSADASVIPGAVAGACALGDINGDNKPDLLVTGEETIEDNPLSATQSTRLAFRIFVNKTK